MKDILLKLIDVVQSIAVEQATREFSGLDWGKQTVDDLQKIKDTVLNFPENENDGKKDEQMVTRRQRRKYNYYYNKDRQYAQ